MFIIKLAFFITRDKLLKFLMEPKFTIMLYMDEKMCFCIWSSTTVQKCLHVEVKVIPKIQNHGFGVSSLLEQQLTLGQSHCKMYTGDLSE